MLRWCTDPSFEPQGTRDLVREKLTDASAIYTTD